MAGHKGMFGSAIMRALDGAGFRNVVTASKSELDLRNQDSVDSFFQQAKPGCVILAAAKVGGIRANMKYPVEFLQDNLMIQGNVIEAAFRHKTQKFVFLGSSCIYPRDSPQPIKEEYLLTGPLEPTNEGYALAKIAGLKLLEYYAREYNWNTISLMPCNLYGPNDSFDPEHSHVLSALVKKFCDAADKRQNEVEIWGTGVARREFMHVDDAANAV
ncbi:MAG TPA: NAD-dependent epimerase/dehydratase family protein, partial [Chitinophagaceae bacterium]